MAVEAVVIAVIGLVVFKDLAVYLRFYITPSDYLIV